MTVALTTETVLLPSLPPHGQLFAINNPAWSLFFEFVANALFVTFWKLINVRTLSAIWLVLGFALAGSTFHYHTASLGNVWETAIPGLVRALFSFCTGVIIFDLRRRGFIRIRCGYLSLLGAGAALVFALLSPVPAPYREVYALAFIFLLSPALLILGIGAEVPPWLSRLCTFLGVTSYALYAVHYTTIDLALRIMRHFSRVDPGLTLDLWTAIYVGVFLCIAYVLDLKFDIPVRRALGAWRRRRAEPG